MHFCKSVDVLIEHGVLQDFGVAPELLFDHIAGIRGVVIDTNKFNSSIDMNLDTMTQETNGSPYKAIKHVRIKYSSIPSSSTKMIT